MKLKIKVSLMVILCLLGFTTGKTTETTRATTTTYESTTTPTRATSELPTTMTTDVDVSTSMTTTMESSTAVTTTMDVSTITTTPDSVTTGANNTNTSQLGQFSVSDLSAAVGVKAKECFGNRLQRVKIMKQALMSMMMGNLEDQSSKLKCTSKCVMESYGLMDVNGGVQPLTLRALVELIENPIIRLMVLSRVDTCIAEAAPIQDSCQKSAFVLMCIAKNGVVTQLVRGLSSTSPVQQGALTVNGSTDGNATSTGGNANSTQGVVGDINKAVGSKAKECFESRLERIKIMKTAMKSIMKGNLEQESNKLKCTSKCVMQSFGVMDKNGGLQPQTIRYLVENIRNPFVRKIALERVDCCITLAKPMEDQCQKSAFVVMCMAKNGIMAFAHSKEKLKTLPGVLAGVPQNCTIN